MKYNHEVHRRRSIRLKGYDYSQNSAYFITICTKQKECLFGEVVRGEMILNKRGKIAHDEMKRTSKIRKWVEIDCFVVMPNHVHAIIIINCLVGAYCNTPLPKKFRSPSNNLGSIIRGYKSTVTKQINQFQKTPGQSIWQRNYYEHIIRDEKSFKRISEYILSNPEKWKQDMLFVKL